MDRQPAEHFDEDHVVPIVAAPAVVNGVYYAVTGMCLQVLKLAIVVERVGDL